MRGCTWCFEFCERSSVFCSVHGVSCIWTCLLFAFLKEIDRFFRVAHSFSYIFGVSYIFGRILRVCSLFSCSTSIYDNITYGLEEGEFTEEDVYTAAKQACAHDFISGFAGKTCSDVYSIIACGLIIPCGDAYGMMARDLIIFL